LSTKSSLILIKKTSSCNVRLGVLQIGSERVVLGLLVGKEASVVSFADDDERQIELRRIGFG
jgi:hypothetical protein